MSVSNAEGVKKVDSPPNLYVFLFISGNLGEVNLKYGCAQRTGLLRGYRFGHTFMCTVERKRQEKVKVLVSWSITEDDYSIQSVNLILARSFLINMLLKVEFFELI